MPTCAPPALGADLPLIALVGRPNVGKSTLFNRLTRSRKALMASTPGLTRDRREGEANVAGYRFRVVDTGGLVFGGKGDFLPEVAAQVMTAVESAAYAWLVLDVTEGLNPLDVEIYRWLQSCRVPMLVAVNKADNRQRAEDLTEFYALGTERLFPISALHGSGLSEALAGVAEEVPIRVVEGESGADAVGRPIRVAFLGRPNVGKSTMVNRALGDARMIVSQVAGTTREAIEVPFQRGGRDFLLVDTAGIRRRARTTGHLEKIGVLSSLGALHHAEVAVLVVDCSGEVAEQDARLAGYVLEHRRALVVAMNKWDRVKRSSARSLEADIRHTLRFVDFAAHVRTSGQTGTGMGQLLREVVAAHTQYHRSIQTAELNRMLQESIQRHPPPSRRSIATKIYYGTQIGRSPARFRFFTNHPEQIRAGYTRYLVNQIRAHFGFRSAPVELEWRGRKEPSPNKTGRRKSH